MSELKAWLLDDDRGVSPVISVILMVAITVILAAVIATFVMNMGPDQNSPANANWDWSNDNTPDVTLTHEGGGAATATEYKIVDDSSNEGYLNNLGFSGDITAGNSATFSDGDESLSISDGTKLQLIWEDPDSDQTQIVDEYTVST